ncbi:hypothetical protein, partial [Pseudomonas syringae group genomosp. 7]|uniref:hypothetical protein n=1 Tax=Pseudomonas syringae group genomosp. 7 TaxID=251699 RepID=UPI00376F7616
LVGGCRGRVVWVEVVWRGGRWGVDGGGDQVGRVGGVVGAVDGVCGVSGMVGFVGLCRLVGVG